MTREFDHVRQAFAASALGKGASALVGVTGSAWRTSTAGRGVRAFAGSFAAMPPGARVRAIAIAVTIAAMAQPMLMMMMPATVVPAVPIAAYLVVATFAAGAAWQADALVAAWPASRLARLIRR